MTTKVFVRPGAYSRCLSTPSGWVWVTMSTHLNAIEATRLLTGEVLWTTYAPAEMTWAHLDADVNPLTGEIVAVVQTAMPDIAPGQRHPQNDKLAIVTQTGVNVREDVDCSGIQSAVVRWNGRAMVIFSKTARRTYWRQELGQDAKELPGIETADGWFDITAGAALDGSEDVLSWADTDRFRVVAGLGLMEATKRQRVWFGQETSTVDRLVGVLDGMTPILIHEGLGKYPRVAVSLDGSEYAATWANLGGSVSVTILPPFKPWTPYQPPPMDFSTWPTLKRPIWIGVEYGEAGDGNFSWGYHSVERTGTRPVLEGVEPIDRDHPEKGVWLDHVPLGQSLVVYDSPKDNPQYSAAAQAAAVTRGVPWFRYWDGQTYEDGASKDAYIAGVQAYYPTKPEVTRREVDRIGEDGRQVGLVVQVYDGQGAWPRSAILEQLRRNIELANECPEVVLLAGFGKLRPGAWWSDIAQAFRHVVATMPPGPLPVLQGLPVWYASPSPSASPSPTEELPEEPPRRPSGGGGSAWPAALPAIGAGILALVRFFRRKKPPTG